MTVANSDTISLDTQAVPKNIAVVPTFSVGASENVPKVFQPIKLRDLTVKNRIFVSPMCQYSCKDGFMNSWHLAHLGQFAIRGAGLIIFEATAVVPEGRISPDDAGIWKDEHIASFKQITDFIRNQGSSSCLQLAHAGRKASTYTPFVNKGYDVSVPVEEGGWPEHVYGPADVPFGPNSPKPKAMTVEQIKEAVLAFKTAARRALEAGFDAVEIHSAHGYLLHEFLSPLVNTRTDEYGGSFENRTRFLIEVIRAVRQVWPKEKPLFVRLSCNDFIPGGWDSEQNVRLASLFTDLGVDLVDCSSGVIVPTSMDPHHKDGWNVPYAHDIKKALVKEDPLVVGAVGGIKDPDFAETLLREGKADIVLVGRGFLLNGNLVHDWQRHFGLDTHFPSQYRRSKVLLSSKH